MKIILSSLVLGIFLLAFTFVNVPSAEAARVRGYYKPKTGTYVQPHYRTNPNRSIFDNWSTKGNLNPYTGKWGTRNPFKSYYRW